MDIYIALVEFILSINEASYLLPYKPI